MNSGVDLSIDTLRSKRLDGKCCCRTPCHEILLPFLPRLGSKDCREIPLQNLFTSHCGTREKGKFPSGVSGEQCFRWVHCASTRCILGARRFQNRHFRRISSTLVFQSLGGHASAKRVSHKPCFRQAHCFRKGPLRFLPVPPNPTCARSHIWGVFRSP